MRNASRLAVTAGLALALGAGFAPIAFAETAEPAADQASVTAAADDQAEVPFWIDSSYSMENGEKWVIDDVDMTFWTQTSTGAGPEVTWSSSDASILSVDATTGAAKAQGKAGDVTVTATEVGGTGRTQTATIHVVSKDDVHGIISANSVSIDPSDLDNGYSVRFPASELNTDAAATVLYARYGFALPNGEMRYVSGLSSDVAAGFKPVSSNPSVATCDGMTLRFVGVGEADITLKFPVKSSASGLLRTETKTIHVDVINDTPEDHGVAIQTTAREVMNWNTSFQLRLVNNWDGKGAAVRSWESSDPSVATINEEGNVIPVKPGKVTFTGTSTDGRECSVTFTLINPRDAQLEGISAFALSSMGEEPLPIVNGQTLTLNSVKDYGGALFFNALRYTYEGKEVGGMPVPELVITSSNESVAKPVEGGNRLNFVGAGTTQITVAPAASTLADDSAEPTITFTLVIKDADGGNGGNGGDTGNTGDTTDKDDTSKDDGKSDDTSDKKDDDASSDKLPQTGDVSLIVPMVAAALGSGSIALGAVASRRRRK